MTSSKYPNLLAFLESHRLGLSSAVLAADIDFRRAPRSCIANGFEVQNGNLSRAQRRQMKKLSIGVDKITDADRKFFDRFPHRQHRLRLAGRAEIEHNALLASEGIPRRSPNRNYYAMIKSLAPGWRLRMIVVGNECWDTDVSEQEARACFEAARIAQVSQIEQELIELSCDLGLGARDV